LQNFDHLAFFCNILQFYVVLSKYVISPNYTIFLEEGDLIFIVSIKPVMHKTQTDITDFVTERSY